MAGRIPTTPRSASWRPCVLALALAALACGADLQTRLAEIRALQAAGQFNESIEPLREILKSEPDSPEANHLLGIALLQTGQPSLAVWSLEKATQDERYAVESGLLLASAFLSIESFDDAIRAADKVLAKDPTRAHAVHVRAHANLGASRLEDALRDADRLLELKPGDYQAVLLKAATLTDLKRLDESEQAYAQLKEVGAASGDPVLAARGWLAYASFIEDSRKDDARAEAEYLGCAKAYPTDGLVLQLVSKFYLRKDQPEKADDLWRRAMEEAPENLQFRVSLAQRLQTRGKNEEAEKLLVEAADTFGTSAAWSALADLRRTAKDTKGAVEAMDKAIELAGGSNDPLLFRQADLLVDLGELDRARASREQIKDPVFQTLLQGRILMAEGDQKGALAAFEEGIRRWPNNAGARYLAGVAAYRIGDYDRAASELREAVRADAKATDAALLLAELSFARANWKDAAEFAQKHLNSRPEHHARAAVVLVRTGVALDKPEHVTAGLNALREAGQSGQAAAEEAYVAREKTGSEAAARVVEKSGVDLTAPENEPALRSLADDLISLGRGAEALARVDAALGRHADQASFHELRGVVLVALGKSEDATRSFEKALALDAGSARAMVGLGTVKARAGDVAGAIEILDRATAEQDPDRTAAYLAAQLVQSQSRLDEAVQRLRAIVATTPAQASARNDLAWILADRGEDLDTALQLARDAARMQPSPEVLDTLGWVHYRRGEYDAALQAFEGALNQRDNASVRYRLGLTLAKQGDMARAQTELRSALGSGSFPESKAAQEELARLETR